MAKSTATTDSDSASDQDVSEGTADTAYVVEHSMVGPHLKGEVIRFGDEFRKAGHNVRRLLHLGAIREASSDEAQQAVPFGQAGEDEFRPIPAVPFDARATGTGTGAVGQSPTAEERVATTTGADAPLNPERSNTAKA